MRDNPRNFIPLDDNVIYEQIDSITKLGSLYIPENAESQYIEYGRVIEIGPGRVAPMQSIFRFFIPFLPVKRIKMQVKIGDTIFFGRQTAMTLDKYDSHNNNAGTTYKCLPESRILAKTDA